ncbi:MAG: SDR family NAD(P)-dependent oxidoreductase, partial [Desulfofustis sp.]|nr:SDR family NAD(P)-dependent oxidoreductase [Desulfofustis sp.]
MDAKFPEVVMPKCPAIQLLKGQKAMVTGANSGIGRAVAAALGHAGADVIVNYVVNQEEAEEVCEEIRHCSSSAKAILADVADEQQVQDMFR